MGCLEDPVGDKAESKWTESTRGKMNKIKWNNTVEGTTHFIATTKFTVPFWILSSINPTLKLKH